MAQKPKHGDVVHMKGTVSEPAIPASADDIIRVRVGDALHWVAVSEIVHVEPQPLKVGDPVIATAAWGSRSATIIGIDGPIAWIRYSGQAYDTSVADLSSLKRADEPRPLKVGDKVRFIGCKISHETGEIVQIDRGDVWVKWGSFHTPTQWSFAELERVE